jgi:hypothetical protein
LAIDPLFLRRARNFPPRRYIYWMQQPFRWYLESSGARNRANLVNPFRFLC